MKIGIGLAIMVAALSTSWADTGPMGGGVVYKWKDDHGVTHYGDRPARRDEPSEMESTLSKTDLAGGGAMANRPAETGKPEQKFAEQKTIGSLSKEALAERKKNCEQAREAEQKANEGTRMVKEGPNGEREFMDEKAMADLKVQIEKQIKEFCD